MKNLIVIIIFALAAFIFRFFYCVRETNEKWDSYDFDKECENESEELNDLQ